MIYGPLRAGVSEGGILLGNENSAVFDCGARENLTGS